MCMRHYEDRTNAAWCEEWGGRSVRHVPQLACYQCWLNMPQNVSPRNKWVHGDDRGRLANLLMLTCCDTVQSCVRYQQHKFKLFDVQSQKQRYCQRLRNHRASSRKNGPPMVSQSCVEKRHQAHFGELFCKLTSLNLWRLSGNLTLMNTEEYRQQFVSVAVVFWTLNTDLLMNVLQWTSGSDPKSQTVCVMFTVMSWRLFCPHQEYSNWMNVSISHIHCL